MGPDPKGYYQEFLFYFNLQGITQTWAQTYSSHLLGPGQEFKGKCQATFLFLFCSILHHKELHTHVCGHPSPSVQTLSPPPYPKRSSLAHSSSQGSQVVHPWEETQKDVLYLWAGNPRPLLPKVWSRRGQAPSKNVPLARWTLPRAELS